MRANWVLACTACAVILTGCAIDKGLLLGGARSADQAEIRIAIRSVTQSPVKGFGRTDVSPPNLCYVYTADGKTWRAIKFHGKWYFEEAIIVLNPIDLYGRWS